MFVPFLGDGISKLNINIYSKTKKQQNCGTFPIPTVGFLLEKNSPSSTKKNGKIPKAKKSTKPNLVLYK